MLFSKRLFLALIILFTKPLFAQSMDLFGGPFAKIAWIRLSGLEMTPKNDDSLGERGLQASLPVYQDDEKLLRVSFKDERLLAKQENGLLRNFGNQEYGFGFDRNLEGDRSMGFSLSYGSASDRVFSQGDVSVLSATATYKASEEGSGRWIYLVNYSNNRPFLNNVPLPGFAYIYRPSPQFFGIFGAPFASFNWQFKEDWTLQVFGILPWILKTQVQYKILGPMQAFAGFDFSQRTFFRADRTSKDDRVFYDERKILAGLKTPVHRRVFLDFEMGYVYDRRIFEAQNFEFENPGEMKLSKESYAKLSLTIFLSNPEVLRPK